MIDSHSVAVEYKGVAHVTIGEVGANDGVFGAGGVCVDSEVQCNDTVASIAVCQCVGVDAGGVSVATSPEVVDTAGLSGQIEVAMVDGDIQCDSAVATFSIGHMDGFCSVCKERTIGASYSTIGIMGDENRRVAGNERNNAGRTALDVEPERSGAVATYSIGAGNIRCRGVAAIGDAIDPNNGGAGFDGVDDLRAVLDSKVEGDDTIATNSIFYRCCDGGGACGVGSCYMRTYLIVSLYVPSVGVAGRC